jgi:hypothetical protein
LIKHLTDVKGQVEVGFILFALKCDPTKIKSIVGFESNGSAVTQAFKLLQYSDRSAAAFA